MLSDDVELFLNQLVDDVERGFSAVRACTRAELVLFGFEVTRERLSPRWLRLLFDRGLSRGLLRRLRALLESAERLLV